MKRSRGRPRKLTNDQMYQEIRSLIKAMQKNKDDAIKEIEKNHAEELRQIRLELIAVKMGYQNRDA